jgi:hypothetical protein
VKSIVKFVPVYVYDESSCLEPSKERKVVREVFEVVVKELGGE